MADIRDISTLPLSRSIVDSLLKNGFRFVSDLKSIQPLELAQEIGTTPDVALTIIQCAESSFLNSSSSEKLQFSAKDLLTKCELSRPIISFCKAIDVMMGGGVQIGQITEFCGVPGVSCFVFDNECLLTKCCFFRLGRLNWEFSSQLMFKFRSYLTVLVVKQSTSILKVVSWWSVWPRWQRKCPPIF
jgi:hypothetical protein